MDRLKAIKQLKFRPFLMELIGTFALCYIGGWACIMAQAGKINLLAVALAHMSVLAAFIYVGASISGGHYNPAVTLALFLTKNHSLEKTFFYILFQFMGSFMAGYVQHHFVPIADQYKGGLGYPNPRADMKFQSFICEMIGTFVLTFMVFGCVVDKSAPQSVYGCTIGGALGASILAFGPISGSALNPARWLGPAVLASVLCNTDKIRTDNADKVFI